MARADKGRRQAIVGRRGCAGRWPRVLISVLLLWGVAVVPACGERSEPIVRVESQRDAIAIAVALESRGIRSVQIRSEAAGRSASYVVQVPASAVSRSRSLLDGLDLPRPASTGLAEIVSNQGLIPTRTDERARLMHALAGDLAQTLEVFDGVIDARVHVFLPDSEDLNGSVDSASTPRAAVVIKHRGPQPRRDGTQADSGETAAEPNRPVIGVPSEGEVKTLLKNAVAGIEEDGITVVFTQQMASTPFQWLDPSSLRSELNEVFAGALGNEVVDETWTKDNLKAALAELGQSEQPLVANTLTLSLIGSLAALSAVLGAALYLERRRRGSTVA